MLAPSRAETATVKEGGLELNAIAAEGQQMAVAVGSFEAWRRTECCRLAEDSGWVLVMGVDGTQEVEMRVMLQTVAVEVSGREPVSNEHWQLLRAVARLVFSTNWSCRSLT